MRRTTTLTRGLPAGELDASDAVEERLDLGLVDKGLGHFGFLRLFGPPAIWVRECSRLDAQ